MARELASHLRLKHAHVAQRVDELLVARELASHLRLKLRCGGRCACLIRPKTYVDAMKGKIVISQLYEQVNMQKSSRKCKMLARAKQYRLLHPTEGWQKRGGTTMYLPSSAWKYLFCRFSVDSQVSPVIESYLALHGSDVCFRPSTKAHEKCSCELTI